jgi:tricorn protease
MMSTQQGYYRFPTLNDNTIVFVCEDDLWLVPRTGGRAIRLTANLGEVAHPFLSPDGDRLAFIGQEEGHREVYVMPATGGVAKRLTFLGAGTTVVGWSPDGQFILFRSNTGQPFSIIPHLYRINWQGGLPEKLSVGLAHQISYGPQGGVVISRNNFRESAYWKRYRGGTAGVIWIDLLGDGNFQPLIDLKGDRSCPMWIGDSRGEADRIFFISDHEGIGNLYSCTPDGSELTQHTRHCDYYVRHATTDGQAIVYQAGGDLFCYQPGSEWTPQPIVIEFYSPQVQKQRKFIDSDQFMEEYDLHPDGHSVVVTTRGKSFACGNWEGAVTQLGSPDGIRYRLTRWLNDHQRLVTLSDQGGEEALEIWSTNINVAPTRLKDLDIGRAIALEVSPIGNQVALSNHRHELIVVDLESWQWAILDRSEYRRIEGLSWSPDGKWVAYSCAETQQTYSIKLCHVSDRRVHCLTPPRFRDIRPTFDPTGKFIYFLSVREFNPVYDSIFFDLNFPRGMRPFLIALKTDTPSPFIPIPRPLEDSPEDEKKADTNLESSAPPVVEVDFDGIDRRIAAFPVPEGIYEQIWGLKDKVLFTTLPVQGSLDVDWRATEPEAAATLELYDLKDQKHEKVATEVTSFRVSRGSETLIYRSKNRLRVCKVEPLDDETPIKDEPSRESGWLNLDRVRVSVDVTAEWQQMLHEIWRLQRDHFWTADLSGVDWSLVWARYSPLLTRITTRSEFSDLVWEMQGELGTSHAYELGGDYRQEPNYKLGFLGADFAYDPTTDAYRITHIVQGDPWSEQASSPLQRLGNDIKVGDVLLAIGGQRLSQQRSPQELLVHQSGCEVTLTLAGSHPGESRTITVKTLASETPARYREWVEANHRRVQEATNGRVGYVHVPDMGPDGYAEFHRYYAVEVEKEALIVDVRYNGGGHVSPLLLEKLLRRRVGYDVPRWGKPEPYPAASVMGPMVALTNEYAGSDGDIFSHCFKLLKLGTLIGKRTWGGVIGIWPRHALVDGSLTSQPEFSFWFTDVGWGVENHGTDPDIPLEITPQDWGQGRDPQLEKAIGLILEQLTNTPVGLPEFGDRPQLSLPK